MMLQEEKELYRSLFENMLNGFAYCRMYFDQGRPIDFIYLNVNSAFESLTGLKNVVGKKVSEVIPGIRESDPELFEIYGRVALTGKPEKFEKYVEALKMWFSVSVYSPKKEHFAAVFDVITERKQAQEALQDSEKTARRLAKESELIAEIGRIISSTLNIEEVYERFAEKVREVIPFDRIAVNTINMKDHTRTIRYVKGGRFSGDRIGEVLSLAGTGVVEQVLRTKSSLLINSKNREDMVRKYPGIPSMRFGAQSTMMIPLISKDELIGILAVHSSNIDAYSDHDLLLAERMASQIAGAVANAQLFLERKQAEEELKASKDFIETVLDNLADPLIVIDPVNFTILGANKSFINAYGHDKDTVIGKLCYELTHNRSTPCSPPHETCPLVETLKTGNHATVEHIHYDNTGSKLYVEITTVPIIGSGGEIQKVIHLSRNITERKRAEEALKESEAKYYDLYEKAPDMYYSLDFPTGTIKECNETFLRTTGYTRDELIGRPIFELYDSGSIDEAKKSFQQFPATGEVRDAERRVRCKDGRIIDVSLNVSAIRDKDGNIVYSRSIWRDITERKEQEEMIRALSITDQLTGLYNRRGFTALAEHQLRIAERTRNGIVLLFADVDDLKKINDKLGHKSGDEAIVEASTVLKEVFRKMDIIARMGGDEFAVLAPEASLKYSEMIKDRLQDQLIIHNSRAGRDYNLSLSTGMVYHDPSTPSSLDELISRADSLMYEQKRRKMPLAPQEGLDT